MAGKFKPGIQPNPSPAVLYGPGATSGKPLTALKPKKTRK
jgi:hypothetical protein